MASNSRRSLSKMDFDCTSEKKKAKPHEASHVSCVSGIFPQVQGKRFEILRFRTYPRICSTAFSIPSSPSPGHLSHMAEYLHEAWAAFMPRFYWLVPCCQTLCIHGLQLKYLVSVLLHDAWEPVELRFVSGKWQSFSHLPGRVVLRSRIRAITNALDCSMVWVPVLLSTQRDLQESAYSVWKRKRNKICWLNTGFLQHT